MLNRSPSADPLSLPVLGISLAIIFISGLMLRLESWDTLALCHFDEGVHAATVDQMMADGPLEFDFAQPLHSPPLYPWMVGAVAFLKGAFSPVDLIYVSAVFGALTPLALFALGRRLHGNGFGLAAAGLLAASDVHIAVSRMGMPHAVMLFWFTLGVWSAAELAARPLSQGSAPRLLTYAFYGVLLGSFGSLAWTTLYSGWMIFGVLLLAAIVAYRWQSQDVAGRWPYLFVAGSFGVAIGLASFVGWYWHVEREFPGGAMAIFRNHRLQIDGWLLWPTNVGRHLTSLGALRHLGWLVSLAIVAGGGVVLSFRQTRWRRSAALVATVVAAGAAISAGVDALLLLTGVAGILPAVFSRRWPLILCAVWLAVLAFFTPIYFPQVRLLAPLMPPAILLSLSLVWPVRGGGARSRNTLAAVATRNADDGSTEANRTTSAPSSLPWLCGGLLATLGLAMLQPFGVTPTRELWRQWSARSGYRQFQQRVAVETPDEAAVICQGQPPLVVYCPRDWRTLFGDVAFTRGLEGLDGDHPVYLAVDFRWLHGGRARGRQTESQEALVRWLHCLEPTAVVPFEPSIAMVLAHLPPRLVDLKIHTLPTDSQWTDRDGRKVPAPPDIRSSGQDVIVLYRINLQRIGEEMGF